MLGCRRSPWLCRLASPGKSPPMNKQTRPSQRNLGSGKLLAWQVGRGMEDIVEREMGKEVIWGSGGGVEVCPSCGEIQHSCGVWCGTYIPFPYCLVWSY